MTHGDPMCSKLGAEYIAGQEAVGNLVSQMFDLILTPPLRPDFDRKLPS